MVVIGLIIIFLIILGLAIASARSE